VRAGVCSLIQRANGGEADTWEIAGVTRTCCDAALRIVPVTVLCVVERRDGLLLAITNVEEGASGTRGGVVAGTEDDGVVLSVEHESVGDVVRLAARSIANESSR
jgi:hypothetical protein